MPDQSIYHLEIIIDDLTNSIRQVDIDKSFATDVLLATKEDIKTATKVNGWHFLWSMELKRKDKIVYKLIRTDQTEIIQGLISLSVMPDHVYVHLAESAPINYGPHKLHVGVGGNLFAFACKKSWDEGNQGIISFQSKTKLIAHYEKSLGAISIGHQRMIIYPEAALNLINKYFNN
jgi:hypothetical protein